MNILFVSAVCPFPQHSGGQIRIYQLLKKLSVNHKITLICYIRSETEKAYINELKKVCSAVHFFYRGRVWNPLYILKAAISHKSLLASSYDLSGVNNFIQSNLHKFDLIHMEPYYVYSVVPCKVKPQVVAEHNIEYQVYSDFVNSSSYFPFVKLLMKYDISKMRQEEQLTWKRSKAVVVVSEQDKIVLDQQVSKNKIHVVPNGVDTSYYSFKSRHIKKDELHFLFVGNFLWTPNINAIDLLLNQLWQKIIHLYPNARLTIIGKHLNQNLIKKMHPSISYFDTVDDMRPYYHRCSALLSPTIVSGGTKYKILESFASGLPVITPPEGVYGLPAKHKEHALLISNTFNYLDAILWLITESTGTKHMTEQARNLVVTDYDWNNIAKKLEYAWENSQC